jgi:hypothetical protein
MNRKYRIKIVPGVIRRVVYVVYRPLGTLVVWKCMTLSEAFERIELDLQAHHSGLSHDLDVYIPSVLPVSDEELRRAVDGSW